MIRSATIIMSRVLLRSVSQFVQSGVAVGSEGGEGDGGGGGDDGASGGGASGGGGSVVKA